jgi:hypothetical protein
LDFVYERLLILVKAQQKNLKALPFSAKGVKKIEGKGRMYLINNVIIDVITPISGRISTKNHNNASKGRNIQVW